LPAVLQVRALTQLGIAVQLAHVSALLGSPGDRYVPDWHVLQREVVAVVHVSGTRQPLMSAHWMHWVPPALR
jgi:hypothetical protein